MNASKKTIVWMAIALASPTLWAQPGPESPKAAPSAEAAAQAGPSAESKAALGALSEGEVRKVDKEAGKVTIKHGPLDNLEMPPMTMVFKAKNPSELQSLKAGDKVRFMAEKDGGAIVVTRIEVAPE